MPKNPIQGARLKEFKSSSLSGCGLCITEPHMCAKMTSKKSAPKFGRTFFGSENSFTPCVCDQKWHFLRPKSRGVAIYIYIYLTLQSLLFSFSLLFCLPTIIAFYVCFLSFPRILGVLRREEPLLFFGVSLAFFPKSSWRVRVHFCFSTSFPKIRRKKSFQLQEIFVGINFPKVTFHVFICDSENYMEKRFGNDFLWEISQVGMNGDTFSIEACQNLLRTKRIF